MTVTRVVGVNFKETTNRSNTDHKVEALRFDAKGAIASLTQIFWVNSFLMQVDLVKIAIAYFKAQYISTENLILTKLQLITL